MNKIEGFKGQYRWLSNFAPVVVEMCWVDYPSVEHAYQASKTDNPVLRKKIAMSTAADARKLGPKVDSDWRTLMGMKVMYDLLMQKFSQEPYRSLLLATGDAYIEETNWWKDEFWGVYNGNGQNHLGLMIMEIREYLRSFSLSDASTVL